MDFSSDKLEIKDKIDSSSFHNEIQMAFKSSPLEYSNPKEIINKLNEYKNKAFELFKIGKFYESACIYKGLLEKCIENLSYIDDKSGLIGDFLFQSISYYSQSISELNIDENYFFEDSVNLYLKEDYGFSIELSRLILTKINLENYSILEKIIKSKILTSNSKYLKEKLINLALTLYELINDDKKYLDICNTLPINNWERYVYVANKYVEMGLMEKAVETYKEGINNVEYDKEILEEKYTFLQKKIIGLD
ncbi:MAG: hypothetical protein OEV44_08320 [Spirochaetota bacterium]|nr:hypothetical protein [Spirochaetota bacterium]